jgi:proteasome accessory factor C
VTQKLSYERYVWFHKMARAGRFPNAGGLPGLPPIKEYIRRNFGVIAGDSKTTVELRFSPAISPLIAEQEWHEAQEVATNPDGRLRLRFPVPSFVEIIREILKYGADVEVVEPARLRAMVKDEIRRMAKLYR